MKKFRKGQRVMPVQKFAYRPPCTIVEVGEDDEGTYFVAEYPTGDRYKQYDKDTGTSTARFQKIDRK